MKKILVLGAGHSAPFLIRYLLDQSESLDTHVTVGDLDVEGAARLVGGHPRGRSLAFDITDEASRRQEFADADVVVHLLPPKFQPLVAEECLAQGTHMVSASYRSRELRAMSEEAERRGVALLCELGLDPGIDVMSAERIIADIHARGGVIDRFCSYGGGLPEPEPEFNPLRYCITWNPHNVVMAAHSGACFLRQGEIHLVPWERVFSTYWTVDVPGLGLLEAYANRDSLGYREVHGLNQARTLVRGTLRYPGWCHFWRQMVRLGLPNEELEIPDFEQYTWADLLRMFLPDKALSKETVSNGTVSNEALADSSTDVRSRVAAFLGLEPSDDSLQRLDWLGLFSDQQLTGRTPAAALVELFQRKLKLPPTGRDLVVLYHELDVSYPDQRSAERIRSTFLHFGEPGGITAMAQGVGFPASVAVKLLLQGRLTVRGAHIPTHPEIYGPILAELESEGLSFDEQVEPLPN